MSDAPNILNDTNAPVLPLSLMFLKSVVAGLGIMLVLGFTFLIGTILLGGKYLVEQTEFQPYAVAKNLTLPLSKDSLQSARITPAGIEILQKTSDDTQTLSLYSSKTGEKISIIVLKQK